ncbi:MAG: hypothetical protein HRU28_10435 [Rhizobiales bacterium]|nr:hypothetical protein [Hyphomicrobiales bacterium]
MKKYLLFLIASLLLTACEDEVVTLNTFTSPHGGVYALRVPDQVQVTTNSFFYEVKIINSENDFTVKKTYKLERMNFHSFTPTFKQHQLQYLHIEYFTFPQNIRDKAYSFLQDWDEKTTNNPDLFKVQTKLIFALCSVTPIPEYKIVTTIFKRQNKSDGFKQIYDNLESVNNFKNLTVPTIVYQNHC